MKHNIFLPIIAFLCIILFSTSALAQNLGVYPTTLDFKLSPGQSEAQTISLSNGSGEKVQFRIYMNDWVRDSTGGHAYFEPATQPRSCAKWLTLDKNFIELKPGESTQLTVQMKAPANGENVDQMKWAMIFIETIEENISRNDENAQASVRNLLRVGVHVYQTPANVSEKAIEVIDLVPNPEILNAYDLVCKNAGEVMIECKAYIELVGTDGSEERLDLVEFPMFPDQIRYVTFEVPKNMPDGEYSALGVLDAGEDLSLEAIESTINVKSITDEEPEKTN